MFYFSTLILFKFHNSRKFQKNVAQDINLKNGNNIDFYWCLLLRWKLALYASTAVLA